MNSPASTTELILENDALAWRLAWPEGHLATREFRNKRTDRAFALSESEELVLVLSAGADALAEPVTRVTDFEILGTPEADAHRAVFHLSSPSTHLEAHLHYLLDGPTRRKWAEITNATSESIILLDVELDCFGLDAPTSGGGQGQPLALEDEAWAAVEYPSGENTAEAGRVKLAHFPGVTLPPGESYTSHVAVVGVAAEGQWLAAFTDHIASKARRQGKVLSIYTPFGINNQWGPCPTLPDEETLDVLDVLERWQGAGMHFDCFTLDTGWVDPASDHTRFRPNAYPNGPGEVIARIEALGMKFGLWFATSWAAESCWGYEPAWTRQEMPTMPYLNGCPDKVHFPGFFCFGVDAYERTIREAVLHHVRENGVRFIKFDGGNYRCDNPEHGHLPGKYSTERMYGSLIEIADAAREIAPDLFVMWYWGLRSPFWALYGDSIFESGLHMEGSGTSSTPTLYYRDSVTLAQDQNAQHAQTIPPVVKDSLGVWLADTRWGNFMGKERWREALVMDLGRGSLLFPNIWGDVYLLDAEDVEFLAWIGNLAKENAALFQQRRTILGDPWRSEVYGYAHVLGERGFLFINNPGFESREVSIPLDRTIGLEAEPGVPLDIIARFPACEVLLPAGDDPYRAGDTLRLWVRPFEALMLEVKLTEADGALPMRALTAAEAAQLGRRLVLEDAGPMPDRNVQFTEAPRFEQKGFLPNAAAYRAQLPSLEWPQPILAVAVRLRQGDDEWRYSPCVAEIVQVRARIGGRDVQMMPVPDARQFGNTQHAGCSWVLYKVRLSPDWSGEPLQIAVHAWLPEGVAARTEAYVVKRWWQETTRPLGDGYYADAPS